MIGSSRKLGGAAKHLIGSEKTPLSVDKSKAKLYLNRVAQSAHGMQMVSILGTQCKNNISLKNIQYYYYRVCKLLKGAVTILKEGITFHTFMCLETGKRATTK